MKNKRIDVSELSVSDTRIAVYVEDKYHAVPHSVIRNEFASIQSVFCQVADHFVYLPHILSGLDSQLCSYMTGRKLEHPVLSSSAIRLDGLFPPEVVSQIHAPSILFLGLDQRCQVYPLSEAHLNGNSPLTAFSDVCCRLLHDYPELRHSHQPSPYIDDQAAEQPLTLSESNNAVCYSQKQVQSLSREFPKELHSDLCPSGCPETSFPESSSQVDQTTLRFDRLTMDKETDMIVDKIEQLISQLQRKGYSLPVILKFFEPQQQLSPILVTKDYRVILTGYDHMEILFPPLLKAVYLLFLRHPEGISFKCLIDHRDELLVLYRHLAQRGSTARQTATIDALVNPLNNAMNEKCTRIKNIFHYYLAPTLSDHYCITGGKGEKKRIPIDPSMIQWE